MDIPPFSLELLAQLFVERGAEQYSGEAISQTEHALQAGTLAEQFGAAPTLVAAAFLHDVGHLLHNLGEHCADEGVDDEHELTCGIWLENYFPRAVTEPIKLHVQAKRYRCGADARYLAALSPTSLHTLGLQGGPMTAAEQQAYRTIPFAEDALLLRAWDEAAKVPGAKTPPLAHFLELVATVQNAN
jgi:phosphonate degradation associated HDIG domain protein